MRRPAVRCHRRYLFLRLCACTLIAVLWIGNFSPSAQTTAIASDPQQSVQSGIEAYETGDFLEAIALWHQAYENYEEAHTVSAMATVSKNLALAYQQIGQTAEEITHWENAIAAFHLLPSSSPDSAGLSHLLTEQAQAYSRLGQHRKAIALLCTEDSTINAARGPQDCQPGSALQIATASEDTLAQVAAIASLGEAYRASGEYDEALHHLNYGREIVHSLDRPDLEGAILNGLGSLEMNRAQVDYRLALEAAERGDSSEQTANAEADEHITGAISYFEKAYTLLPNATPEQLRLLLNLIPAYIQAENWAAAEQYQQLAIEVLAQMPNTQHKAFATIRLASFIEALNTRAPLSPPPTTPLDAKTEQQATDLLRQAVDISKSIGSYRAESFALGRLGYIEERAERYEAALEATQFARLAAGEEIASEDSQYLWAWQAGRILEKTDRLDDAEVAYQEAILLLEKIRDNISSANKDLQFDFRDSVEPVYRQYAALSLKRIPSEVTLRADKKDNGFRRLDSTLNALDQLQIAELQSYFANDCVISPVAVRINEVYDQQVTAIISTAILDNDRASLSVDEPDNKQLAVIVSFPNGDKKTVYTQVNESVLKENIKRFRRNMEDGRDLSLEYNEKYDQEPSQHLYQWLIGPIRTDLDDRGIDTLVFTNDGLLRSIPMAALHDGEQYLIENFAIATTPSLTLSSLQIAERSTNPRILLMGVSEASSIEGDRNLPELKGVDKEIKAIAEKFPKSKTLLNEDFSTAKLREEIAEKDYRILHMATHGFFEPDPTESFIVMGAKAEASPFNETLKIRKLDTLIREASDPTRQPIELLTLTACETAVGDNRATLGLAGVAVRAGVQSAIASLWAVSDSYTAMLISQFYDELQTSSVSKAKALQAAQIDMIRSENKEAQHPYRWAPFVLIGNWL